MRFVAKGLAAGSVFIAAGVLPLSAWGASGYSWSGYKWRDRDLPMPYYVYTGVAPPGGISAERYVNAVKDAFQKWQDVPTTYMSFSCKGETSAYYPNLDVQDGRNVVGWAKENLGSSLGVTVYWIVGTSIEEADIALNKNKSWSSATPTPSTAYDMYTAILHEAGHTLSLDDVYQAAYSDQVMYYALGNGEMRRELGVGDKAGITFIYPKRGDLAISGVGGPSSAVERQKMEVRATIQNVGSLTTGSCRLEFYLSTDSRIDGKDTVLGGDLIPSLGAGQKHEAKVTVTLPAVATEGNYHVCAAADAKAEIQEISEENNQSYYFPLRVWLDSDGDGMPNWWENEKSLDAYSAAGDNGSSGDPDGDGLVNIEEYRNGTNPRLADTDGDGQNDRYELIAGTDPNNANSVFKVQKIWLDGEGSNRRVRLAWQSVVGKKYRVYYQERVGSAWVSLGSVQSGTGGVLTQDDAEGALSPRRFYIVTVE